MVGKLLSNRSQKTLKELIAEQNQVKVAPVAEEQSNNNNSEEESEDKMQQDNKEEEKSITEMTVVQLKEAVSKFKVTPKKKKVGMSWMRD